MVKLSYTESHSPLLVKELRVEETTVLVELKDQDETGRSYLYRWSASEMNAFLNSNEISNYINLVGRKVVGNVRNTDGKKTVTGIVALVTQASL